MAKQPSPKTKKPAAKSVAKSTAKKTAPAKKPVARKKAAVASTAQRVPLMVTVSGLRGTVGDGFTALSIAPYIDAFARIISGKRVVLGHDARPSAKWVMPFVEGILRSRGIDVVNVGLIPTPTVGLLTRKLKAGGGICITASHNPIEYNGIKFFSSSGEFFSPAMIDELKDLAAKPQTEPNPSATGKAAFLNDAAVHHLNDLLKIFPPAEKLRASKRPKVIIDCCNSAGVEIAPDVADAYGALFQMINSDSSANYFPRGAEPLPENIGDLCKAVVKEGADIGFAIDPDADRLALVDENGRAIGEERTLLLAADAFFSMQKKKSPIVVNLSSSRAIDDLAARHKVKVYRTRIGEANVMEGIRVYKAKIGGEGNGGVIVPAVQPGRDAATGIALILLGMQMNGKSLSEWNAEFPDYVMIKHKIELKKGESPAVALNKIKRAFKGFLLNTEDGVKASQDDRWIHVRPSNTEPIMRVYAEGLTREAAMELVEKADAVLS